MRRSITGLAVASAMAAIADVALPSSIDAIRSIGDMLNPNFLRDRNPWRCHGPGWTHAQVKRMARKARNRRRHRMACRKAKP